MRTFLKSIAIGLALLAAVVLIPTVGQFIMPHDTRWLTTNEIIRNFIAFVIMTLVAFVIHYLSNFARRD